MITLDPQDVHQLSLILMAAGLGAAIGLEREIAGKPAGLRTHTFVCAGSTLLMCLGETIIRNYSEQMSAKVNSDPIRVIQAIVVGISFLGAGTIIHEAERVEGLTTAASIYLTAGIGVAAAVDRVVLAASVTAMAVLVLILLGWIEKLFDGRKSRLAKKPRGA